MTRSGTELPPGSERCPVGRDRVWRRRQPPRCRAAPVSSSLGLPDPPLGAASSPAVASALLGRAFPAGVLHPRRRARIRRIQRTSSDTLVTMPVTRADVVRTREARGRGGCASRRIERDHHPLEVHAAGTAAVKPGNGHPGLPRRGGRHHGLTNSTETVKRTGSPTGTAAVSPTTRTVAAWFGASEPMPPRFPRQMPASRFHHQSGESLLAAVWTSPFLLSVQTSSRSPKSSSTVTPKTNAGRRG